MEQGEACKEMGKRGQGGKKEQSDVLYLHGNDSDSDTVSQDTVPAISSQPQDLTMVTHLYHQWHIGQKKKGTCVL